MNNQIPRPIVHYSLLGSALLLGCMIRFWQLDSKPLWLDEVITALFSLGHTYRDIPLDRLFPLSTLSDLFVYQPGLSCAQIAQRVATDSVHPPLFFCLMYRWMGWLSSLTDHWVWALRSLPALLGVGAIAALYGLNRIAFSPTAGLAGAALMAVSPFAVYLSQEARHYTLPMLLITVALTLLIEMQRDLSEGRSRLWLWSSWVVVNLLGLYVHYFVALAVVAQITALAGWLFWSYRRLDLKQGLPLLGAIAAIGLGYAPWIPTMLSHITRPETDWLHTGSTLGQALAPLYQFVVNWAIMLVMLPVESQPLPIAIICGLIMLIVMAWTTNLMRRGLRKLWRSPVTHPSTLLIGGFTLAVLAQFVFVVYGLGKDLTIVPRYNFVWYPGIVALLGASLTTVDRVRLRPPYKTRLWKTVVRGAIAKLLLIGLISSGFVVFNLAFLKPFHPDQVAQTLAIEPDQSLVMVVGYRSMQEVALGLSFAVELHHRLANPASASHAGIAFVQNPPRTRDFWQRITQLPLSLPFPLNLWVVGSTDMKLSSFPDQLRVQSNVLAGEPEDQACERDRTQSHRIGFPYQLYRCPVQ